MLLDSDGGLIVIRRSRSLEVQSQVGTELSLVGRRRETVRLIYARASEKLVRAADRQWRIIRQNVLQIHWPQPGGVA